MGAEEGRGKLRKAPGSRRRALIRGSPNGISCGGFGLRVPGPQAWDREPPERKHPSRGRKRNQNEIPSVGATERGAAQTEPPWVTVGECGVIGAAGPS